MKRAFLHLTIYSLFLTQIPLFAQRYNAGPSSGTGGDANTYVGAYAGQYNSQPRNSFFGWAAGQFSGGSQNVYVGYYAGYWNSSIRNTFVGYSAGSREGSTGSNNTFLGWSTGILVSSGAFNTFVGSAAGSGNTTGSYNTFLGMGAGQRNNGFSNTFLGYSTGLFNTAGSNNVFLGSGAGIFNTGSRNTFLGMGSNGSGSGAGSDNSFMGYNSGYSNTGGTLNTFVGNYAGQGNTTGHSNAFFGYQAGYSNNSGYYNTLLGVYAGKNNGSAVGNTMVGYYAGYYNTGSNNNFSGYYAGYSNSSGQFNTFVGNFSGLRNSTGTGNVFLGYQAGYGNTTGAGNTIMGHLSNVASGALSNATAIGNRAWVSASNAVVLGAINGVNGSTAHTRIGIGTSAPSYRLHLNASDAAKVGGGSWVVASDQRLKKDIGAFSDGLDVLMQIKPVTFRYNGKAGIDSDKLFVGVIAQEMKQIAPYTVGEFVYQDSTGKREKYLDYDPNALTYILVNSVKELQAENEQLMQKFSTMEARLASLEKGQGAQTGSNAAARLDQNRPNPYQNTTTIPFYIPEKSFSAKLKIYSITGQEVFSKTLEGKGEGQIELSGADFRSGTYIYHLEIDGRSVASKKLVVGQ